MKVEFPTHIKGLPQDEEFCIVHQNGSTRRVRFHDYNEVYTVPGLYEHLFYEVLQCISPQVITDILISRVKDTDIDPSELSVLDLGAGNGMVAEALRQHGASHIVGADIIPEAKKAAQRDRPEVYDDYVVADFTKLNGQYRRRLEDTSLNCLTCVAALGFADIPPAAFTTAFNLIDDNGWIAFNIKDDFVSENDQTRFSGLIMRMIEEAYLDLHVVHHYQHRLALDQTPLYYFAIVGRKRRSIPT